MEIEPYCRWLSHYFFVRGMEPDDLYQEALLAAWLAEPGNERIAARRRILDLIKFSQRRPPVASFDQIDPESPHSVSDVVDAREKLRLCLDAPRTDMERRVMGMRLRGEPIPKGLLDWTWYRVRQRVLSA